MRCVLRDSFFHVKESPDFFSGVYSLSRRGFKFLLNDSMRIKRAGGPPQFIAEYPNQTHTRQEAAQKALFQIIIFNSTNRTDKFTEPIPPITRRSKKAMFRSNKHQNRSLTKIHLYTKIGRLDHSCAS